MNDFPDQLGELSYRQILAGADIDMALLVEVLHQKQACVGEIIRMEEFPARIPGAPNHHLVPSPELGVMELADHRRKDVRGFEIEVVVGPVEVSRHG